MRNFGRWMGWVGVLALAGCAEMGEYQKQANVILPENIKKIGLKTFINRTQYFGLEDRLRLRVEQEMIRDGRLPFSGSETDADGVIEGEIVNYIPQVVTYDAANQPLEYRLWVIINVRFFDRRENRVLWEEPRLEQAYRYFIVTQPGGMTEDQAREQVWDLFARDIVKRTLEGFGSVSGASSHKVPENTLPVPNTPPPPPPPAEPREAPPAPY
ncbi:MAG: LptE family protein [Elusimicrobia bacterium]|nr:LptE family protein [Elusimicrobiota bacterium]